MARGRNPRRTRAERNIAWIERYCIVPEGRDVGKPVRLRDWQRSDLRKIYDNPVGTRTAIISFAKKNGKTSLAACLLLLHLCGPEHRRNTQLPSTAQSRDQAAILFNLAAKMVRMSPALKRSIVIREALKQLHCPDLGTLYKALSSDVSTAHGQSPVFAIHDELGQVQGPTSALYNAIENAMGAHDAPMSIIISTQAPTDGDLLSILIDDARAGHDKRVVLSLYTAEDELDPFSDEALRQANPALGDFLNLQEVRDQAQKAKRMPSQEADYRNFTLNQRVEKGAVYMPRSVWARCAGELCAFEGRPVFLALDLSETTDLTCLIEMCPVVVEGLADPVMHVRPTFWLPEEGIVERSKKDRVPYDVWAKQGHLFLTPGGTVDYAFVAAHVRHLADTREILGIGFDRWNVKHFIPRLVDEGFPEEKVTPGKEGSIMIEVGQGFASMSPALRSVEELALNGRLVHGNHPVLNMCMANAVVQSDPAGNRKLTKAKSRGRIDGAVALAMVSSIAAGYKPPVQRQYQVFAFGGGKGAAGGKGATNGVSGILRVGAV